MHTKSTQIDARRLENNALDLLEFLEEIAAIIGRNKLRDMYVQSAEGTLDLAEWEGFTLTDGSVVNNLNFKVE